MSERNGAVQFTTLTLLLLHEPAFKRRFAVLVLRHYPALLDGCEDSPHLLNSLDRITVHLFNQPVSFRLCQASTDPQMGYRARCTSHKRLVALPNDIDQHQVLKSSSILCTGALRAHRTCGILLTSANST